MSSDRRQERRLAIFIGDLPQLQKFLAKKRNNSSWIILKFFDALFRGFGQVVLANNPISGFLITGALAIVVPGMMVLTTSTAILGLLISVVIGEPQSHLENGLTVFNPLLCGAVTHALTPGIYDTFDARLFSYLLFSILFRMMSYSVYLTRALGSGRLPGLSAPFNVVQLIFIFTLASRANNNVLPAVNNTTIEENSTAVPHLFSGHADLIISNTTNGNSDWGLVFRGIITSASQVYAVDNVPVSSIIYLAILTYSPIMAGFSFFGAMLGSITGLVLAVPVEEAYCGLWGYNSFLTTAALGGLFVVPGLQTTFAALFAGIFSTILQYVLTPLFAKMGLPVLSVPFVLTTWLFLGLQGSAGSGFIQPETITFPEKHRYEFIEAQHVTTISSHRQSDASHEIDISAATELGHNLK